MSHLSRIRALIDDTTEHTDRIVNWLLTSVHQKGSDGKQHPIGTPLELTDRLIGRGYPSGGDGGGNHSGISRPTENAVAASDPAEDALRQTLKDLRVIGDLWSAIEFRHASFVPHRPTSRDRLESENKASVPLCESCKRVGVSSLPRQRTQTTVNGALTRPVWLCGWCEEKTRRFGRTPSKAAVKAHDKGRVFERIVGTRTQLIEAGSKKVVDEVDHKRNVAV